MTIQDLYHSKFTGLILLSGVDTPGVTEALFQTLTPFNITILDMEQVTIRGRLILTALIELDPAHALAIEEDLTTFASEIDLDFAIDFTKVENSAISTQSLHIVVLAEKLKPTAIAAIARGISAHHGNIERFRRTASFPLTAIEFDVSLPESGSPKDLQRDLATIGMNEKIDLSVEVGGLTRRSKRIVLLDMDSTFIQQEVLDLLADEANVGSEVRTITEQAMEGELDFTASLTTRVALLAGLPERSLESVRGKIELTSGARTLVRTLHRLGHKVGIVSGGFTNVIAGIAEEMKLDYFEANTLEISNGALTGKLVGPIIDGAAKAQALRRFAEREGVPLAQTIAIGDGANDLDMIKTAGLGIAFNAKPVVKAAADSSISVPYLDAVLFLIGITGAEIEEADRSS